MAVQPNLSPDSMPWARDLERQLDEIESGLNASQLKMSNLLNSASTNIDSLRNYAANYSDISQMFEIYRSQINLANDDITFIYDPSGTGYNGWNYFFTSTYPVDSRYTNFAIWVNSESYGYDSSGNMSYLVPVEATIEINAPSNPLSQEVQTSGGYSSGYSGGQIFGTVLWRNAHNETATIKVSLRFHAQRDTSQTAVPTFDQKSININISVLTGKASK